MGPHVIVNGAVGRLGELPPLTVAAAVELSRSVTMLGVAGVYSHPIVSCMEDLDWYLNQTSQSRINC